MTRILALDPGFAAFGAVILDDKGAIVAADVADTAPNTIPRKKPPRPLKNGEKRKRKRQPVVGGLAFDNDRRVVELYRWLVDFARPFSAVAAVAESPGGSALGFTAAQALALANAVARLACLDLEIELHRVSVQQWRRTFVPGQRVIPDEDLYDAIGKPAAAACAAELATRGRRPSLLVHALDGVGIGRWSLDYCAPIRRELWIDEDGL